MLRFVRFISVGSWMWLLLTASPVIARPQAPEPPNARIVQMQFGHACGWCTSPSESFTEVRSNSVTIGTRNLTGQLQETKSQYVLGSQEWEELLGSIDSRVLAALTGTIGCPGCADQPTEWVEVEFDDGTKKSAYYDAGSGPPQLAALINKLQSIIVRHGALGSGTNLPIGPVLVGRSSKPARMVSIRFGQLSGWCDGYCSMELRVTAGEVTLLKASTREVQRRYPDLTVRSDLSEKHWRELVQLVDRDMLFALPDHTSCGTCTDGEDEFVEVRFSDHSRKRVQWGLEKTPKELKDLSDKLRALETKLSKEFPPEPR